MEINDKYSKLEEQLEMLCQIRRYEILENMLKTDDVYKKLCKERTEASVKLKNKLIDPEISELFENYSDAIFAQECYEIDSIYKKAISDALDIMKNQGLI